MSYRCTPRKCLVVGIASLQCLDWMGMGKRKKIFFDYKKNQAWTENLSIVMQIGLTMVGCICFCFFVGLTIDKWAGTRGVFVSIFTIMGVAGGGNVVYRQILEITESHNKASKAKKNGAD